MRVIIPEKIYVLGEINGISRNTLRRRVRISGWDLERAATDKLMTRAEAAAQGVRRRLTDEQLRIAESNGISNTNVLNRLNCLEGWTLERAITEPINTFREAGRRGKRGKVGMGNLTNSDKMAAADRKAARESKKQKRLEFIKLADEIKAADELRCEKCKEITTKAAETCNCDAAKKVLRIRREIVALEKREIESNVGKNTKQDLTVRAYENYKDLGYTDKFVMKAFKISSADLVTWKRENGLTVDPNKVEVVEEEKKSVVPVVPAQTKPVEATVTLEHHERVKAQHEQTNSLAVTKLTEAAFKPQAAEREIAFLKVWQAEYMKLEVDYLNEMNENKELKARLDKLEHQELLIHLLMKNAVINDHDKFEKRDGIA